VIYTLLFRTAAETLLAFGRNARWLGGTLGITMVLHNWGQKLDQHIPRRGSGRRDAEPVRQDNAPHQ
jgi:hypothetical protein